jgi:hypothetical protein
MLTTIQKLLLAFVTLIVGLVLVTQIAVSSNTVTTTTGVASETHTVASTYAAGRNTTNINPAITYTLTNAPSGWKTYDCPITNFVLRNSSGSTFTVTTDYVFNTVTGTYTLVDSAHALASLPVANNNTYATYSYCGDNYLNLDWGRSVLALTPGFFALALLIFSVGMFYSLARDAGIL